MFGGVEYFFLNFNQFVVLLFLFAQKFDILADWID